MPQFPRTEAEIIALAQQIIAGLNANPSRDGAVPVNAARLQDRLTDFLNKRAAVVQKQAESRMATGDKDEALEFLIDDMKADLRRLEELAKQAPDELTSFGWAAAAAPTELQPPGQPRVLEAPKQGNDWLFLDWKEAIDGGATAFYKIQRRARPAGAWEEAGSALVSEATLTNQPKTIELEYRVVGVNRAGESTPSNVVMAVL